MTTRLTKAADLAADWGMTEEQLHRRRRRHNWPCVKLGRTDVRFTDEQIELIIMQHSQAPKHKAVKSSTGQTKRSARRSA